MMLLEANEQLHASSTQQLLVVASARNVGC